MVVWDTQCMLACTALLCFVMNNAQWLWVFLTFLQGWEILPWTLKCGFLWTYVIIFLGLRILCPVVVSRVTSHFTMAGTRSLLYTPLAATSKFLLFLFWIWFWDRNQLPQILSLLPQPFKCQYHRCVLSGHVRDSSFSSLRCWSSCFWLWSMSSMDMEWCLTVVLLFRAFMANDVDYPPLFFVLFFLFTLLFILDRTLNL